MMFGSGSGKSSKSKHQTGPPQAANASTGPFAPAAETKNINIAIAIQEVDNENEAGDGDDGEEEDKDGGTPNAVNESPEKPGGEAEEPHTLELGQLDEEMVKRAIQMKPRSLSFVFHGAATVASQNNTQRASIH